MWRTKLVRAVRAAILSVSGNPCRNTAPTICSITEKTSSTAARMTLMNPPRSDFQAETPVHDDRPVNVELAVPRYFHVNPVHGPWRRPEEVDRVPIIPAAVA